VQSAAALFDKQTARLRREQTMGVTGTLNAQRSTLNVQRSTLNAQVTEKRTGARTRNGYRASSVAAFGQQPLAH